MQDEKFITLLFKGIKNKLKQLFNLLFKFFLIFLTLVISFSLFMKLYEDTDETKKTMILSELSSEYTDYCYTNNTGDTETLQRIDDFINEQPIYVKDMFFEQEWGIVITKNASDTFKDSINILDFGWVNTDLTQLKSLTASELKLIYLSNKNIKGDDLYDNFIHEFGHFYDYINGNISMSYKFKNIYKMNKYSNLYTAEEKDNITEFFAASYALYKLEPEKLENDSVDVYNYMKDIETKLENRHLELSKCINFSFGIMMQMKLVVNELIDKVTDMSFF